MTFSVLSTTDSATRLLSPDGGLAIVFSFGHTGPSTITMGRRADVRRDYDHADLFILTFFGYLPY
jgi:hypothetical protein